METNKKKSKIGLIKKRVFFCKKTLPWLKLCPTWNSAPLGTLS